MSDCTVYIDEAGDLGIRRGTRWFVLSAVVVDKTAEPQIRAKINSIRNELNIREIHLQNIHNFYKRGQIVRALKSEDFTYMNVLVDTNKFDSAKIPSALIAYNYTCKYLLQRVSWYLESTGKIGDIMLSARGTARDRELIEYITDKLFPYEGNKIAASVFGTVSAKTAATWDLLQLADVCATTMFSTYEVNHFGFSIPCFSLSMADHLYKRNGKIDGYGIKFFTSDMKPDINELKNFRPCSPCK